MNIFSQEKFNYISEKIVLQEDCYEDGTHNYLAVLNADPNEIIAKTQDDKIKQDVKDYFPKPKNGSTFVIAHRGAHNGIPENTLAAYIKAIEFGCDFVEIDVRKTKDGRFVSIHNSTVDAYVEGISGKVSDFTLKELKQMNIGKRISSSWENERIPTFEEILQLCKGQIGIYLDLKEPYVNELVEIIKNYGMERDIFWYIPVSQVDAINELKNNCDKCIPMPDPDYEDIVVSIDKFDPQVIAPVMDQYSKEYLITAHELGVKVFVDEKEGTEDEWEMLLKWGTDGIQTNYPEELINYLKGTSEKIDN